MLLINEGFFLIAYTSRVYTAAYTLTHGVYEANNNDVDFVLGFWIMHKMW